MNTAQTPEGYVTIKLPVVGIEGEYCCSRVTDPMGIFIYYDALDDVLENAETIDAAFRAAQSKEKS